MPKTIIGPHTRVAGPLSGTDDLVVEGIVEGTVTGEAQVTIAAGAKVGGVVRGRDVVVGGALDFNVYGSSSVRLLASAEVRADIEAPRIAIDDGALFEGQVKMVRGAKPAQVVAPIAKGPPPPAPPTPNAPAPAPTSSAAPRESHPAPRPSQPAPRPSQPAPRLSQPAPRAIPELPAVGKRKLSRRVP